MIKGVKRMNCPSGLDPFGHAVVLNPGAVIGQSLD